MRIQGSFPFPHLLPYVPVHDGAGVCLCGVSSHASQYACRGGPKAMSSVGIHIFFVLSRSRTLPIAARGSAMPFGSRKGWQDLRLGATAVHSAIRCSAAYCACSNALTPPLACVSPHWVRSASIARPPVASA